MDDPPQSGHEGHGSLILAHLAVLLLPLCLVLAASILSAVNLAKILSYNQSAGVIANVTISTTQGKTGATFYDYAVSFETAEKQKIYTNVGKTVFFEAYVKGEAVTVYHDPANPFAAFVNHVAIMWFVPVFLVIVAFVWFSVGLLLIRRGRGGEL